MINEYFAMFAFNLHMLLNIWQSVLVLFRYINFVFDFVVTDKNENVMSLHDLLIPLLKKMLDPHLKGVWSPVSPDK